MKLHVLTLLFLAAPVLLFGEDDASARADVPAPESPEAMKPGSFLRSREALAFKLGWGLFSRAGETHIETTPVATPEGPRLRVRVRTESKGIVDSIYPLSTDTVSLIDPATGRTLSIETRGKDGKRTVNASTVFDYEKGEVVHTDKERPARSGTVKLPDEPLFDLMVTIMRVRQWDIKPGEKRRVQCIVEDDIYDLEITALQNETIKTPAGRFETVVVEPKQLGELKGFFRKGGTMRFWISRGEKPQIVRMDFRAKFGTFSTVLEKIGTVPETTEPPPAPDANPRP